MKTSGVILFSLISSAAAAPALVWKNGAKETNATVRTSTSLPISALLNDAIDAQPADSELAAVIFLLGRMEGGKESFSELAASGAFPRVASKYETANDIHHHVDGLGSTHSVVRDARHVKPDHNILAVDLSELNTILTSRNKPEDPKGFIMSKVEKYSHKRMTNFAKATVLVVEVDPSIDASKIDSSVVRAIEDESVATVVVTAVRSHEEVKNERRLVDLNHRKFMAAAGKNAKFPGRRRLEDADADDAANDSSDDLSGVYYVSMTPNIFSGILFSFFFIVVVQIGISCMGMISGQDVYVNKMPSIGREA